MNLEHPDLKKWSDMAHAVDKFSESVQIALIGKYNGLQDSYLSVIKSLKHASIACERKLDLVWVEASQLEDKDSEEYEAAWEIVRAADGIIVPGGFGNRGFKGKCLAAEYCRKNKKPYLGICLGFQAMVVEYARNVIGWDDANSAEFDDKTAHPVVIFMPEIDTETMGGNMRLGARNTKFTHKHEDGSVSTTQILYGGAEVVSERHRHRYEVNPNVVDEVHSAGLKFVGRDDTGERMEVAELPRSVHPYFVGCQYHPEFKSRPLKPSPPFHGLIMAAAGQLNDFLDQNS
jgi:CTP synthase